MELFLTKLKFRKDRMQTERTSRIIKKRNREILTFVVPDIHMYAQIVQEKPKDTFTVTFENALKYLIVERFDMDLG